VPDIDYYAECRAPARIGGPGFGTRCMRSGTSDRSRNEGSPMTAQQPQHDRESNSPDQSRLQYARSMAGGAIAVSIDADIDTRRPRTQPGRFG
jgi:hypothetical protein